MRRQVRFRGASYSVLYLPRYKSFVCSQLADEVISRISFCQEPTQTAVVGPREVFTRMLFRPFRVWFSHAFAFQHTESLIDKSEHSFLYPTVQRCFKRSGGPPNTVAQAHLNRIGMTACVPPRRATSFPWNYTPCSVTPCPCPVPRTPMGSGGVCGGFPFRGSP